MVENSRLVMDPNFLMSIISMSSSQDNPDLAPTYIDDSAMKKRPFDGSPARLEKSASQHLLPNFTKSPSVVSL